MSTNTNEMTMPEVALAILHGKVLPEFRGTDGRVGVIGTYVVLHHLDQMKDYALVPQIGTYVDWRGAIALLMRRFTMQGVNTFEYGEYLCFCSEIINPSGVRPTPTKPRRGRGPIEADFFGGWTDAQLDRLLDDIGEVGK